MELWKSWSSEFAENWFNSARYWREPCLSQSPIKVSRMLKPDKWQAIFDTDGKVFGFQKALKSIVLGMMWAADFDESLTCDLEENCLEALVLQLPRDSGGEIKEITENGNGSSNDGSQMKHGNMKQSMSEDTAMKSASAYPFCGLTRNFWSRSDRMQIITVVSSTKNGDDELPVSVWRQFLSLTVRKSSWRLAQ